MNPFQFSEDTKQEIIRRLKQDYPEAKDNGQKLHDINCPECGKKKKCYMYKDKPYALLCGSTHCGAKIKTTELYPDLKSFRPTAKPTPENPHAIAEEYLKRRGICETVIEKLKRENKFSHLNNPRGINSGAIMFHLNEKVSNGRIYNPPEGEDKGHNIGSTQGLLFTTDIDEALGPVYLTEGIFDSLAFNSIGLNAWSYLSAVATPDFSPFIEQLKKVDVILAPDNDEAGRKSITVLKEQLEKVGFEDVQVIAPPKKQDWNDLLNSEKLEEYLDSEKANENGRLLAASNALQYSEEYYSIHKIPLGVFEWDGCTYYGGVSQKKNLEVEIYVTKIGSFIVMAEHTELLDDNEHPEHSFSLTTIPKKGVKRSFKIKSDDIITPCEAKKTFLSRANCLIECTKYHDAFVRHCLKKRNNKIVRQAQHVGLDEQTGAYIMPRYAVHGCKLLQPDNGMFKIQNELIKPFAIGQDSIEPRQSDTQKAYDALANAFKERGKVALAWTFGNFFRDIFIEKKGFFPFMSLYGPASCGKSTMAELMSCIRGLNYEGHPINKSLSTSKGVARTLSQFCNSHVGILEATIGRDSFDMGLLLPLYNGGEVSLRAKFNNSNETHSELFKSSILFVQNIEPFQNEQQKSRVISLKFSQSEAQKTTEEYKALTKIDRRDFVWLGVQVLVKRQEIADKLMAEYEKALVEIRETITHIRVAETHAFIIAAYKTIVQDGLALDDTDLKPYILELAQNKEMLCKQATNAIELNFFDVLYDLIKRDGIVTYEDDNGQFVTEPIARWYEYDGEKFYAVRIKVLVKSEEFESMVKNTSELRDSLIASGLMRPKSMNVRVGNGSSYCWLIKASALEHLGGEHLE